MAPHATGLDRDSIPSSAEDDPVLAAEPLVPTPPDSPEGAVHIRRDVLILVNVWLVFHLFAILVCPASVEPSSPLAQFCFRNVAWYLHSVYLDHGFHFFAPDPGPSTLVSYKLEFPDGTTESGRLPDRSTMPRLLYHRYFMLTEFLGNGPEESLPFVERALARNLCRRTGAIRVSLTRVMHELPTEEQFRKGMRLNDPSLFIETPLGTYTAEELRLPFKYPADRLTDGDAASSDLGAANADAPVNVELGSETRSSR